MFQVQKKVLNFKSFESSKVLHFKIEHLKKRVLNFKATFENVKVQKIIRTFKDS